MEMQFRDGEMISFEDGSKRMLLLNRRSPQVVKEEDVGTLEWFKDEPWPFVVLGPAADGVFIQKDGTSYNNCLPKPTALSKLDGTTIPWSQISEPGVYFDSDFREDVDDVEEDWEEKFWDTWPDSDYDEEEDLETPKPVWEVGDIVTLSEKGKEKWRDTESNPHGIAGEVTGTDGSILPIQVSWENDRINSYDEEDLEEPATPEVELSSSADAIQAALAALLMAALIKKALKD